MNFLRTEMQLPFSTVSLSCIDWFSFVLDTFSIRGDADV